MNRLMKSIASVLIIILGFTGCTASNADSETTSTTSTTSRSEDNTFNFETDKITVLRWQDSALQDNKLEALCDIEDNALILNITNALTSENWKEVSLEEEISAVPEFYISFNNGTMIKLLGDIAYGDIVNYTITDGLYDYSNGLTYYFPEEFLTLIVDEVNKEIKTADDIKTGVSERLIKDNIHELNNAILSEIVRSYFLVYDFESSFNEHDIIDYTTALKYMMSGGTYPIKTFDYWILFEEYYNSDTATYTIPMSVVEQLISNGDIESSWFSDFSITDGMYILKSSDDYMRLSMRPEIFPYFNYDTELITVPSNIVNAYITCKFNTVVDYSQIKDYSENNDTYSYYPFIGEFYYDILIDDVSVDDDIVRFTSTLTNSIDKNPTDTYKATFSLQFVNGEYKFLSVNIKPSPPFSN